MLSDVGRLLVDSELYGQRDDQCTEPIHLGRDRDSIPMAPHRCQCRITLAEDENLTN